MLGGRYWPEVSIALCAVVVGVTGADLDVPGRTVLVLVFCALLPGAAIVRSLDLRDLVAEATIAVGASIALALLIASLSAYTTGLSSQIVLLALVTITVAANALEVVRGRRRPAHPS